MNSYDEHLLTHGVDRIAPALLQYSHNVKAKSVAGRLTQ